MKFIKLTLFLFAIIMASLFMTSCSSDYRSAIPAGSTALISIDCTDKEISTRLLILKDFLNIDNIEDCGIDFREKLYLFETSDGNLGLCAKVSDDQKVKTIFKKLEKHGNAVEDAERQKCNFFTLYNKCIAGYNDHSLIIIGPIIAAAQGQMIQLLSRYLNQDPEESALSTPIMEKLDSLDGSISIVAQANALPQKVVPLFTLGMPKDADLSDCVLTASVDIKNEVLYVKGEPTSFNKHIDDELKSVYDIFRPVSDKYLQSLDKHSLVGMFANVDGQKFLPLIQKSESLWALLAGANQAIDMNSIINSINGDLLISVPSFAENLNVSLAAQLSSSKFLDDVSYWKKSAPSGSSIVDWKQNAYCYSADNFKLYFGVNNAAKPEFYSGSTPESAEKSVLKADTPFDNAILDAVKGKKLACVVSLSALLPDNGGFAMMMIPRTLKLSTVVYTVNKN